MSDRVELLEQTLDLMDEGVAILDEHANVVFWNKAASDFTGYQPEDLIRRPCPQHLYRVEDGHRNLVGRCSEAQAQNKDRLEAATLVSMNHKLGHSVPGMLRKITLHDPSGTPAGSVILFYSAEETDSLPRGECCEDISIERSQEDMEDRLAAAYHQWLTGRTPFGLLWITVDQAPSLRKTHGSDACEAMLRTVEQTLLRQMKPAAVIGRWGCDEFLVLAHERTADLLAEHARRLAGVARTADFRWWGDRVSLTVSIGASQAAEGDTTQSLLQSARQAMQTSAYAGGNHVTEARGRECCQSLELSSSLAQ
jgi:diguanylate cyclase (GGDEF)-like protein/PAS domain S-box-containing protein